MLSIVGIVYSHLEKPGNRVSVMRAVLAVASYYLAV